MPRKNPSKGERKAAGLEPRGPRFLIAIAVALFLLAAWRMLAYSEAFDSAFQEKSHKEQGHSLTPASLNPNSPSKEIIHAGMRVLTTEEPCTSDTQPPAFPTCPAINVAAAFQCPYAAGVGVNYSNPIATDNCSVMAVACNPPSGSNFSVGTTTVICTATDMSGNTATCSFAVNVFSACLVDDANPGKVVLFNASSGDYRFCCNGVVVATGRGAPIFSGCNVTIDNLKGNRHVNISVNGAGSGSGSAYIQKTTGPVPICQINSGSMSGNACVCP